MTAAPVKPAQRQPCSPSARQRTPEIHGRVGDQQGAARSRASWRAPKTSGSTAKSKATFAAFRSRSGSGAKVKGTVYGETVELAGTIEGKIEAKKVVLTSTAHMAGDVMHQDIKIESGAYIDGHCRPGTNKIDNKPAEVKKPAVVAS